MWILLFFNSFFSLISPIFLCFFNNFFTYSPFFTIITRICIYNSSYWKIFIFCFSYNALSELKKSYSKLPNSKDILAELDKFQEKKNSLMQEYFSSKSTMDELYKIRKNYGIYMVRRWRGSHLFLLLYWQYSIGIIFNIFQYFY